MPITVTFCAAGAITSGGPLPAMDLSQSVTSEKLTTSGTTAATTAAAGDTHTLARIHNLGTLAVHITAGAAPTATSAAPAIPAGGTEYVIVRQGYKIAAIETS